ncbi:hypothetical protein, partial [Xanthomonas phaseoli]|uniref:hypothetical protein n=1 Tax=Xanthomonas phaseoli TaxID=1985254 RepID=UPI001ED93B0C
LAVGKAGLLHGTSSGKGTRKFHFWRQLMGGGITARRAGARRGAQRGSTARKRAIPEPAFTTRTLRFSGSRSSDPFATVAGQSASPALAASAPNKKARNYRAFLFFQATA